MECNTEQSEVRSSNNADAASRITRRESLKAAAGAFMILPSGLARGYAANEKINIGMIGLAGMGAIDLGFFSGRLVSPKGFAPPGFTNRASENIVALCDVDTTYLETRGNEFPSAKRYTDFRKMIETEKLDAVSIAVPDHMHAYISVWAMKHGLNVYCQKPLCQTVHEARVMARVAAETKVVTQMGTQMSSMPAHMRTVELIQSGALGEITEIHMATDRPIWPQGFDRPAGEDAVPSNLNWDLWQGTAPARPSCRCTPKTTPCTILGRRKSTNLTSRPRPWIRFRLLAWCITPSSGEAGLSTVPALSATARDTVGT